MKKSIFAIAIIASTLFAGHTTVSAATAVAGDASTYLPAYGITTSPLVTIQGYTGESMPLVNAAGDYVGDIDAGVTIQTHGEWVINGNAYYAIGDGYFVPRAVTNFGHGEYAVKF
jgi:hypothetical protein